MRPRTRITPEVRDELPPVAVATCCRAWQVVLVHPIGRCGHCGVQPSIVTARAHPIHHRPDGLV